METIEVIVKIGAYVLIFCAIAASIVIIWIILTERYSLIVDMEEEDISIDPKKPPVTVEWEVWESTEIDYEYKVQSVIAHRTAPQAMVNYR